MIFDELDEAFRELAELEEVSRELKKAFREFMKASEPVPDESTVKAYYHFKRTSESVQRNKNLMRDWNYIPVAKKNLPYMRRCF